MNFGANLVHTGATGLDLESIFEGLKAVVNNEKPALDAREAGELLSSRRSRTRKPSRRDRPSWRRTVRGQR